MKRKLLSMIMAVMIGITSVFSMGVPAFAASVTASGSCGDNVTWSLSSDGTLTISGTGGMDSNFSYEYGWYDYRSSVTAVVIEDGVTNIGEEAFSGYTTLTSVSLGSSLVNIEGYAFYNCSALQSITIPNSVITIGEQAFYGCTALSSVSLGSNVSEIGYRTFYDCTKLSQITIPASVSSIGDQAFYDCTSLASLTIESGLKTIGDEAFYNCTSLETLTLPDSVTTIGEDAFCNCKALTSVDTGNGLAEISSYAFSDCTALKSLTIGESVACINYGAFYNCAALTSVTIPDSVTRIDEDAFRKCSALNSVEFGTGLATLCYRSFANCTKLSEITFNGDAPAVDGENPFSGVTADVVYYTDTDGWTSDVLEALNGDADLTFYCVFRNAVKLSSASVSVSSVTYTGSALEPTPTVKLNGTTLENGTDYTVSYSNNTNAGTATIIIKGQNNYYGTVSTTFTIDPKSISSANVTLSSTSYTYDGSAKKPSVKSVVLSGTTLSSSDYTVKYASGRKSIGTYKVKVTGTGNYTGTATVTFTIKPAKVTISSAKSSTAKKLTVKWSKVSGSVTGYQVRYKKSTSSSWTTVTVKASTLSKTLSSLTAGKKYNVQVRAYKTVDGTKYYGSWSSKKTVTVKKAQTLTVKSSSSKTVKYSKVKSAKQTVTAISKVSGAKGTVTYSKSSGKSYFTVNSKTGKITVKKGTPKGTYTVKIKVTSAATSTYAKTSKTVTVKIKVK